MKINLYLFWENFRSDFDMEITELPEADQIIKNQNANIKSQLKEMLEEKRHQVFSNVDDS